jgi:2-polyprenyl-3-methyl-5-hydroxy-6-metoxy-1,4-benzoquinol methylase
MENKKNHWENIYQTKKLEEVSWFEPVPSISLDFLKKFNVPKNAKIIDIGGGDSLFIDHLVGLGYENITVLDISETAINRAKNRLGDKANNIKWIITDITQFSPTEKYDYWHDRAAFHFLTDKAEMNRYIDIAKESIKPSGILILGTFSKKGPKKCSGIEIKQYSKYSLSSKFKDVFSKIKCFYFDHHTPFNTVQNFVFCSFKRVA